MSLTAGITHLCSPSPGVLDRIRLLVLGPEHRRVHLLAALLRCSLQSQHERRRHRVQRGPLVGNLLVSVTAG